MYVSDIDPNYIAADAGLSAEKKNDVLGRNQFLQLLVAQLQHQDPLNPLDGTDFSAQLAQFSSLEQLFNMNEALAKIEQSLDAQETENVLDYIGKNVTSGDNNTIFVIEGEPIAGTYALENRANVTIRIYDSAGFEVCSHYSGWKDSGEYSIDWNGMDNNGDIVGDGEYTYTIEARNEQGYAVPVETYLVGDVTGVTYKNGIPFLMMGDKLVSIDSIIEVRKIVATE
jgi:flagellar basal-body rod modification protein FlgD